MKLAQHRPSRYTKISVDPQFVDDFFRFNFIISSTPLADRDAAFWSDFLGSTITTAMFHRILFPELGNIVTNSAFGDLCHTGHFGRVAKTSFPIV
jgi:hypothetical protein